MNQGVLVLESMSSATGIWSLFWREGRYKLNPQLKPLKERIWWLKVGPLTARTANKSTFVLGKIAWSSYLWTSFSEKWAPLYFFFDASKPSKIYFSPLSHNFLLLVTFYVVTLKRLKKYLGLINIIFINEFKELNIEHSSLVHRV